MKKWISNIAAVLWFINVLIWMLLMLPIALWIIWGDINFMIDCGFGTQTSGTTFIFLFGFAFGITLLVPAFRKCFRKLPWIYPYVTILLADVTILTIASEILNYGYSLQNDKRHMLFLGLMVLQIVVCRIAMCIYCHKRPMIIARDDYE